MLKLLDWPLAGDTKCGTCGKVFDTKKLLYFHERNQHVDHGNCNICHKYFASKVKLNIHIQKTHTYGSEKQLITYLCETCGKVFRARSNQSQHMKSHNNIVIEKMNPVPKSFPCINCKKLFKRRWNLKRHMIMGHKKVVLGPRVRLSV